MTNSPAKTIIIDHATHKGLEVVLIKFPVDIELGNAVRKISDVKWSNSQKAWYAPYTMATLQEIKEVFNEISKIDAGPLKGKIATQNDKTAETRPQHKSLAAVNGGNPRVKPAMKVRTGHLREENIAVVVSEKIGGTGNSDTNKKIEIYKRWLQSRRYSENTVITYIEALTTFLLFFADKTVDEITNEDIVTFNNDYILKRKLSSSFQNQVVNSIKLFFKTVQNKAIDVTLIHRPKRSKALPNVLSKEEIKLLLNTPVNVKHKAMLSLLYACGLRCGELLDLQPMHIDSNRQVVIIKNGKGKKDRIAPLSAKIIELLREYYVMYKPRKYLFEGQDKGNKYDARSLQLVLKQNLVKAKIAKPVTLHWLRHSYATHLLEAGTDLRYIQEILGHTSSRTTEIYTHVSTKSIQKIVSPFDTL